MRGRATPREQQELLRLRQVQESPVHVNQGGSRTDSDIFRALDTAPPTQQQVFLDQAGPMTADLTPPPALTPAGPVVDAPPPALTTEGPAQPPAAPVSPPVAEDERAPVGESGPVDSPLSATDNARRSGAGGLALPQVAEEGGTFQDSRVGFTPEGGVAIRVPGVGDIQIPPLALSSPEEMTRWLQEATTRSEGLGNVWSTEPGRAAIPAFAVQHILGELGRLRQPGAAPGAPAEQRGQLRIGTEREIPGQVMPEHTLAMQQAMQQRMAAQQVAGLADQRATMGDVLTRQALGRRQEDAARAAAEQAAQHVAQTQYELESFQRAVQAVGQRQVNPDLIFGGGAGRIGAAIAVAIGEFGSALTGGPNRALALINQQIDRSVRAQEFNIQNERAAANMQGQSVQMMRGLFRDREAADAAARALHLQAAQTQLSAVMAGLTGDQRTAAGQLQQALAQEQAAAAAIAADRARTTTVTTRLDTRGPVSRLQRNVEAANRSVVPQPDIGRLPTRQPGQRPTPPAAPRSETERAVDLIERGEGAQDRRQVSPEAQELMQPISRPRGRGTRSAAGGPAIRSENQRRRRRRTQVPALLRADAEAFSEMQAAFGETAQGDMPIGILQPHPGVRIQTTGIGARVANPNALAILQFSRDGGVQRYSQLLAQADFLEGAVHHILRTNENFGAELVDNFNEETATSWQYLQELATQVRIRTTGQAAAVEELDRIMARFPSPTAITLDNVGEFYDAVANTWNAFYTVESRRINGELNAYGRELDRSIRVTPGMRNALERSRQAAYRVQQQQRRSQRETSPSTQAIISGPGATESLSERGGRIRRRLGEVADLLGLGND